MGQSTPSPGTPQDVRTFSRSCYRLTFDLAFPPPPATALLRLFFGLHGGLGPHGPRFHRWLHQFFPGPRAGLNSSIRVPPIARVNPRYTPPPGPPNRPIPGWLLARPRLSRVGPKALPRPLAQVKGTAASHGERQQKCNPGGGEKSVLRAGIVRRGARGTPTVIPGVSGAGRRRASPPHSPSRELGPPTCPRSRKKQRGAGQAFGPPRRGRGRPGGGAALGIR